MRLLSVNTAPAVLLAAVAVAAAWLAWPARTMTNTPPASPDNARRPGSNSDARTRTEAETTAGANAQPATARAPLKLPLKNPRLVVSKAGRRLELHAEGRVVREYRVGLGQRPEGDKERQGDLRTPVGDYYVCVKNPKSSFYLSLGLSYPNREHAARGLRDKLITRAEHDRIVRAIERRQRPPWDTALGGEIFIHGGGSASDWTWGCLALDNPDVKELFDSLPLGTPVRINP